MTFAGSSVSISDLISQGLLVPGQELRLQGNENLTAEVLPNGKLRSNDQVFSSPTTAANRLRVEATMAGSSGRRVAATDGSPWTASVAL